MRISAVIPALDEAREIAAAVSTLLRGATEVIVIDGGSIDDTADRARAAGALVKVAPGTSRAVAMNIGAALARGDVLYFVHADCRPPAGFADDIRAAIGAGAQSGCFRLRFDSQHWLLRLSAWCTRLDIDAVRFGDQSLFVLPGLLRAIGGFDEQLAVMEDQDLARRLRRRGRFVVIPRPVTASARYYRANGVYRTQLLIYPTMVALYHLRVPQAAIGLVHRRLRRY